MQLNRQVLAVRGLRKSYAEQAVLAGVDISVQAGEVVCLLGPNGAGKTTFISAVLGLIGADSGDISLFGQPQRGQHRANSIRQQLGVMLQIGQLSANLTVLEQCDLFASYYHYQQKPAQLLDICGLADSAGHKFSALSGGQKQRLLFALALAGKPALLFLDEPSLGMDVAARQALWQQIRHLQQQGVAVVLTTHYLEEAEQLASRILVLQQGQIIASGTPSELSALCSYKLIHCHSSLTDSELLALPGVIAIHRDAQQVSLQSQHAEQTVRALLAQDTRLSQLEVRPVSLEQTFLQLTGEPQNAAQSQEQAA